MKAPYDKEGEKVVTRGGGRNSNDRILRICMLVGAALVITTTYASVFGNLYAVAYGVGIGSIVVLTLYYFRGRS